MPQAHSRHLARSFHVSSCSFALYDIANLAVYGMTCRLDFVMVAMAPPIPLARSRVHNTVRFL